MNYFTMRLLFSSLLFSLMPSLSAQTFTFPEWTGTHEDSLSLLNNFNAETIMVKADVAAVNSYLANSQASNIPLTLNLGTDLTIAVSMYRPANFGNSKIYNGSGVALNIDAPTYRGTAGSEGTVLISSSVSLVGSLNDGNNVVTIVPFTVDTTDRTLILAVTEESLPTQNLVNGCDVTGNPSCVPGPAVTVAPRDLFIAAECDYEYFLLHTQSFPSGTPTDELVEHVSGVMRAKLLQSEQLYMNYFDMSIRDGDIIVNHAIDDPFNYLPTGASLDDMTEAVREYRRVWNEDKAWRRCIYRNISHFFTAKGFGVNGYTYAAQICDDSPFMIAPRDSYSISNYDNTLLRGNTIAHEIGHHLSLDHLNGQTNPCNTLCGSENSCDPVMCEAGFSSFNTSVFTLDEQQRVVNFLNAQPQDCVFVPFAGCGEDPCYIDFLVSSDNPSPTVGCDQNDDVLFEIEVCNSCTAQDITVVFRYQTNRYSQIAGNGFVPRPETASTTDLLERTESFFGGECKTFRISAVVSQYSPNNTLQAGAFLETTVDGTDYSSLEKDVVLVKRNPIQIDGTGDGPAFLSTESSFPDVTTACDDPDVRKYQIDGDLIIDVDNYCLKDAVFLLEEDARIIVQENLNLTIDNCLFTTCSAVMWDALDVANASFTNMIFNPANRGNSGYGIYQIGTRGEVAGLSIDNGLGGGPSATFEDCRVAVHVEQSHLWVHDIMTRDVHTGIETINCRFRQLRVFDSDIEAERTGLSLIQNQPAVVIIEDNLIRIDDPNALSIPLGAGIVSAENGGYAVYDLNRVRNNTIHLDTGREGIGITGGRFPYLYNNYVYINHENGGRKGIRLEGVFRPYLAFNQVFGPDAANYNSTFGFWLDGLADAVVECNTTTDLQRGMQFWNLNDNTDLRGNTYVSGEVGLQLGIRNTNGTTQNAVIDEQLQRGNLWTGTYGSGFGAFHASDELEDWLQSFFEVNSSESLVYYPTNNVPAENWIDDDPASTVTNFTCPATPIPPPSSDGIYDKPTELEKAIISGTFQVPDYQNSGLPIARSRTLTRWSDPSTTQLNDPQFQQFITAMSGTPIEQLNADRQALAAATGMSATAAADIADSQDSLRQLTALLQLATTPAARDGLLADLASLQNAESSLLSSWDQQRIQALGQLTPGGPPQGQTQLPAFITGEYDVQQLVIKEDGQPLSATDSLTLLSLAESCPWYHGDIVYQARALFGKFDPTRTFDGDYCSSSAQPLRQYPEALPPLTVVLYPNPTEAYLLVSSNQPLAPEGGYTMYSAAGKIVTVEALANEDGGLYLNTSNLPMGLYVLSIASGNGERINRKFVKQ